MQTGRAPGALGCVSIEGPDIDDLALDLTLSACDSLGLVGLATFGDPRPWGGTAA